MKRRGRLSPWAVPAAALSTLCLACLCVSLGSVSIPLADIFLALKNALLRLPQEAGHSAPIILSVRLPRVLCVMLTGAALSLSGASMQGLFKNPLADGSTMGVSSGAALGAVIAIALGITLPGLPFGGTTLMAVIFAFLSMMLILGLAFALDKTLSTHTMILIGVIFSMFASGVMSVIITFFSEKIRQITFWTMGSLQGSTYRDALLLLIAVAVFGGILLSLAEELNAFAVGEDNAAHVGVEVKKVKLTVLICASVLIGVCTAVGGSISFVGLVTPHMVRRIAGPNHKKLLPLTLFIGADFLLLADLAARCIAAPLEMPIGVVTGIVGAIAFVLIIFRTGRGR